MKVKFRGSIKWYDPSGDDGILRASNGQEFYFNSWSFPGTHYLVVGISKVTRRKRTLRTRLYPGMFNPYKVVKDRVCSRLNHNVQVEFQESSVERVRWAIKIKVLPVSKGLKEWL